MKNFSILLVLFLVSCSTDFLTVEPQDKLTADNFYRTESEIRSGTASLYGFPWFEFNDKFFWCAGDLMSGDINHTWDQEGQYFYFSFGEGNSPLAQGWNGLYRVVSYSNSVINDMPRAAKGFVSQEIINKALGEAHFMRGAAYYILSQFWGEVPLVANSTELVTTNNFFLPKHTLASVYEFIRRDLEFAAENLPSTDIPGRVNKWSAKGLLAKTYLTMASTLTDAKSAENFSKAKTLSQEVIQSSGAQLLPNYYDLFTIENNNNNENLFSIQFMQGSYGIGNSRQANWARSSQITGNTEAWGGGKCVTLDFMQDVEAGDKRQKAIYMKPNDFYPEIRKASGGYKYNIVSYDPADPNNQIEGATPMLNSLKKYIVGSSADNAGKVTTSQAAAINQYVLRLADMYLIYAEAALGAGASTTDAKALEYFNAIRTRAGLSSKTTLSFETILKERRIEFGLESMFWFDIKRYYYRNPAVALAYLNAQERGDNYQRKQGNGVPDANSVDGYSITPPTSKIIITADKMKLPIPASEVVANPLLEKDKPAVEYKF